MQKNRLFLIVLAVFLVPFISAIPGIPHQFYGSVIVNSNAISTGLISAEIDGEVVAAGVFEHGEYGYDPLFLIEDPENNFNGKLITFYINGVKADTYIFENGATTELDFCVETESFCGDGVVDPGEQCDDGNTENDDGCSSTCKEEGNDNGYDDKECDRCDDDDDEVDKKELVFYCTPNWVCSGWSECEGDAMHRKCHDTNNCGLSYNKPVEETGCDSLQKVLLESQEEGEEIPWPLLFLIAILIIAVLVILVNIL